MARRHLMHERGGHTLQATALVNEMYLRLASRPSRGLNREQFLALASSTMRRFLIDYARARAANRRGNSPLRVTLKEGLVSNELNLDVMALEQSLRELETMDPRQVRIVEMRAFGGLSHEEIAAVLNVSSRTVKRDWVMARKWLQERLGGGLTM
jgi:RNA polymerase sigma factor (TIGR02999 family)